MLRVTKALKQWLRDEGHVLRIDHDDETYARMAGALMADGTLPAETLKQLSGDGKMKSPDPNKVFARGTTSNGDDGVRVKDASDQYDETRYVAKSAKTGEPVYDPIYQRECRLMSEGSKARAGVLFKHLANRSGLVNNPLSEHEEHLLDEMATKQRWCGKIGGEHYDDITGHRNVKALIDDATSGGLEITPIEFDSDIISFPLLNGELFPAVDLKPVPRGRRIEGASIDTPSMAWGGGDDTSIDIFSTADMVAAIDTTIFAIDGCVEVGRDFLSDSPVAVGETLTALVGDRMATELDKVVANGNGSTQPEGLFQAAGVGTVTPDNTTTGPPTLDDYIALLFAIGKQYRKAAHRVCFVSNDTTYRRSRAIKIDTASPSTDQRPALSPLTDINRYMTLEWPHRVQNDLGNSVCGIAAMAKYRMYRRLGLDIRFEQGGKDLARRNMILLVYRARFGGKLMDANAFAKWTNGQS
jgi:HK97 family phage major capsid protein